MGRKIPDGYRDTTAARTYGALAVAYYRPSATRPHPMECGKLNVEGVVLNPNSLEFGLKV